ncbi:hypothetical protein F5882DRAFT_490440 [Hyaloscypha sp. PMI_1271]|nr:hypothetical protein F5882DRAFT_490440 [Hyaloscypha sp. PMI_1271]
MPPRKLLLLKYPLNFKDIEIGSLITDYRYPHQDAMVGKAGAIDPQKHCTVSECDNLTEVLKTSTESSVIAWFKNLLSLSVSSSGHNSLELVADRSTTYELRNPRARLAELVAVADVQRWIEEQLGQESDVFMVVGATTAVNRRAERSQEHKVSLSQTSHVPTGDNTVVESGTGVRSRTEHTQSTNKGVAFSTPGERVFAVSVRKVHFNEADRTSYKMDATSKWFPISDNRGSAKDEADEIIEASLNEVDDDCGGLCELVNLGEPCILVLPDE